MVVMFVCLISVFMVANGCALHLRGENGGGYLIGLKKVKTRTQSLGGQVLYCEDLVLPGLYLGLGSQTGAVSLGYLDRQRAYIATSVSETKSGDRSGWADVVTSWKAPAESGQMFVTGEALIGFSAALERHRKGIAIGSRMEISSEISGEDAVYVIQNTDVNKFDPGLFQAEYFSRSYR